MPTFLGFRGTIRELIGYRINFLGAIMEAIHQVCPGHFRYGLPSSRMNYRMFKGIVIVWQSLQPSLGTKYSIPSSWCFRIFCRMDWITTPRFTRSEVLSDGMERPLRRMDFSLKRGSRKSDPHPALGVLEYFPRTIILLQ